MSHTEEPWIADANYVITEGETIIAYCHATDIYESIGHENATRIAACVNACKGFTTKEIEEVVVFSKRYRWLRERDLETINNGGVFAGKTPENLVLSGNDLDKAIDAEML
jgi:hypothetical protein